MKSRQKKKNPYTTLLTTYRNPIAPGSLGVWLVSHELKNNPLEKFESQWRRHFPTLSMMVFGIDGQWFEDLIEVINIAKSNRGYSYLLTVVDVFSKYAGVEPVKSKTR